MRAQQADKTVFWETTTTKYRKHLTAPKRASDLTESTLLLCWVVPSSFLGCSISRLLLPTSAGRALPI